MWYKLGNAVAVDGLSVQVSCGASGCWGCISCRWGCICSGYRCDVVVMSFQDLMSCRQEDGGAAFDSGVGTE